MSRDDFYTTLADEVVLAVKVELRARGGDPEPKDLGAGAAGEAGEGRARQGRVAQVCGEGGEERVERPALLLEVRVVARGREEGERPRCWVFGGGV